MVEGRLDLEVRGNPSFTGDISTDINNVPDALILTFIEDRIFEAVEGLILDRVPALTTALVGSSLYVDQIGDIGLDVELRDLAVDNTLLVGMDVEASWLGDGCPVSGVAEGPTGLDPRVDFEGGGDSDIGIAVTEYQINRLFHGAWEDGLFCFEAGPLSEVIQVVEDALSETIENSSVEMDFNHAPRFDVEEDRITLTIEDTHLAVYGEVDGESRTLIAMDASIVLETEIRIDPEISSFVFSLVNAELKLDTLVADPLLQDRDGLSERLTLFLEGWAMDALAARIDNVPLYGNMFHISDIFLRIDEIRAQTGALLVLGSLYNADDPAVDTEAPDTAAQIASATTTKLYLQWSAEDNMDGPIAYSWRLDSDSWSNWTSESGESMPTPGEGDHIIEVRSRDAWLNVDPSPAMILFRVDPPFEKEGGCGCASTPTPLKTIPWVFLVMMLGVWRRRD
jgi:MYXO-CTERM domain-containing protein